MCAEFALEEAMDLLPDKLLKELLRVPGVPQEITSVIRTYLHGQYDFISFTSRVILSPVLKKKL